MNDIEDLNERIKNL